MEVVTAQMVTSALSKALDAAAGEAGRRSLAALASIVVKWKARSGNGAAKELPAVDESLKPERIPGLAQVLAAAASADPAFAAELADWQRGAVITVTGAGNVTGTVSGTVDGSVVQARDISGPVTFN